MEKKIDQKTKPKQIIAYRRSCDTAKGTGLSHYVMMQDTNKK